MTKREQFEAVIPKAHAHFGQLDMVINNAGYALLGAVEEATEAEVRAEFETNFFGALPVIQTVLPLLRKEGGGHILGVSSVAGISAGPVAYGRAATHPDTIDSLRCGLQLAIQHGVPLSQAT